MKSFRILILPLLFVGQLVKAQVTEFELKETRSFIGETNTSWGQTFNKFNYTGMTNSVVLPAGKRLNILEVYQNANGSHVSQIFLDVNYSNAANKYRLFSANVIGTSVTPVPSPLGKQFIGPCTVQFCLAGAGEIWFTSNEDFTQNNYNSHEIFWRYEISDYGSVNESGKNPLVSSASVVVPSNAVGDVDVLLEQSNDMITWTQCLPGTYNASTQKRFFRVRAVEK
jgi:hypothetical protein